MAIRKSKLIVLVSIVTGMFFSFQLQAQSGGMDLSQCLNYGLNHSPYMVFSKNEKEMFKYDKRDLYSSYLPAINGNFELTYNAKLPVTIMPAGDFGFDKLLPPGLPIEIEQPEDFEIRMGQPNTNSAAIQLEQKIYDHASITGMKGIKELEELSDLNAEKHVEDLMYRIAMAYYQVMVVDQRMKLLNDNLSQYTALLKIMELQLEKGVITQVDFNRVKVAHNNISAQISLMKANEEDVKNNLKMTMGMPLSENIEISDKDKIVVDANLPLEELNTANRLDLRINLKNIALQELNVKVTKYSSLPTLSGFARYGANSYGETFRESWDKFYDFAAVGVKLTVPIFNGLRTNTAYHKQIIQLENLKAQNEILTQGSMLELANSRTKLMEAHTSYSVNQDNLELAQEVYEQTNLSYQKGVTSLSDFLNADYSYKEAQTNYLTSLINMLSSRLDYEKSKGNLINYLKNK